MPAKKNKKLLELGLKKFLDGSPIASAAEIADAGPRTIYRAKERVRKYGAVYAPKPENEGRPRELDPHMMEWLLMLLEGKPDMYLDEMRDELEDVYDRKFSLPTISRRLKEAKWSKPIAVKEARQRNSVARDNYQEQMRQFRRSQLVFVDESGSNEKVGDRKRIWGYRDFPPKHSGSTEASSSGASGVNGGHRERESPPTLGYPISPPRENTNPGPSSQSPIKEVPAGLAPTQKEGRKHERYSILPAFTINGFLCHDIVESTPTPPWDIESFYIFLRDTLLPLCNPFPGDNSVIIMDDSLFHRGDDIRELVEAAGCKLIYLPPCSPDLNPIEYSMIYVKKWINLHTIEFQKAGDEGYLPQFFEAAMQAVDARACDGFFRKAGL